MKIFILSLLFSTSSFAQDFVWFGTTNLVIKDNKTNIMFDPYITHINLWETLTNQEVHSDKLWVKSWLDKAGINQVDAVFINHAHFDHMLDFATVLDMFKAQGYGSQSAVNFALSEGIKAEQVHSVSDKQDIKVGDLLVTPVKGAHGPHIFGHIFMDGKIERHPAQQPMKVWDMKKGQDFLYYVKNDSGNILFHPFARKSPHYKSYKELKARVLFLGIAKRVSTQDQVERIISEVQPEIIIPMHYDNFFNTLTEDPAVLPTMNLVEWKQTVQQAYPNIRIIEPKVGKWFNIDPKNIAEVNTQN